MAALPEISFDNLMNGIRTPSDWATGIAAGCIIATADAYYNILTPTFFDPFNSGFVVAGIILSAKFFIENYISSRKNAEDMQILRGYLSEIIQGIPNDLIRRGFEIDLNSARLESQALGDVRANLEPFIGKTGTAISGPAQSSPPQSAEPSMAD